MIPLSIPQIGERERELVARCLEDNWVSTAGPYTGAFEEAVARYVGVPHAVACASGTAALHLALLAVGVSPGEEVLVPSLTFIAPVNAVTYCGAVPVFMDSQPDTCGMDPQKVAAFLEEECVRRDGRTVNARTGRPVVAILPVHLYGHPVDLDPLLELGRRYGLTVVEDASECLGAEYKGRKIGSFGDIAVFSFNGNKVITTGGGGMVVTGNEEWARRARYLSTQAKDHPVEYVHGDIGYNYRMPNLNAALGLAQMEGLERFLQRKRDIAARYSEALDPLPGLSVMKERPWARSSFWLSTLFVEAATFGIGPGELSARLEERGIQARRSWVPIHRQRPYAHRQAYRVEAAEAIYARALNLPCSVGLTEEEQGRVIEAVREVASAPSPRT